MSGSAMDWGTRNAYRIFSGKPHGNRPFLIHRRESDDNIKTDLRETGSDDGNWMGVAQDRNQ